MILKLKYSPNSKGEVWLIFWSWNVVNIWGWSLFDILELSLVEDLIILLCIWHILSQHQHVQFHAVKSEGKQDQGGIFFLHKKSTCVHPSQYWRQARSLFSLNDHHDQHRWWGLATFLYNLLPCLHLDPDFWGPITGSMFLFLMNHFQVKALAPTKIWP